MPTYQYACTAAPCANRFELVQSFTDPNASECPVCAGPVRKVFSPVGVVFKGSGFYRNDSRKAAGKHADSESTKSEAAKSTPAAASGDTSSSTKPAEKSSSSSGDASSSSGASSNGKSKSQPGTSPAAASV